MRRTKLVGVGLAICVMGAVMTACGAGKQTENGGTSSAEESAAYTDGIAKEPENDQGNSRTASGITEETAARQGAENISGDSAGLVDGRKGNSDSGENGNDEASGSPETENELPPELEGDTYLNGSDTCPDVTFVPDGSVTAEGGSFLLSATEGGTVWRYDEFETLKRYMHGEWYRVPIITGMCGNTSYYDVPVDKPETMDIEWQWLYGELPPGIYCLEKNVYPREVLDAEYEDMEERVEAMEEMGRHVCAPFAVHGEPDIQMEVWDVTPTGLKLQFTHMPGKDTDVEEYNFGSWYELEQYTEGEWKTLPALQVKGKYAWEDLAYFIPAEGSKELEIDWEWLYGFLEEGKYRIHKSIYPEKDASRELSMYTAFQVEESRVSSGVTVKPEG